MKKSADFNDDLIGGTQEPIIIRQSGGSDKKFIYTILILLVVLFIIALGVIFYLGTKFFNTSPNVVTSQNRVVETVKEASVKPTLEEKNVIHKVEKKVQPSLKKSEEENSDIAQLENIINQEEPKKEQKVLTQESKIQKAVANATGGVKLSQEDLKKIAQMVAQQLAQSSKTNSAKKEVSNNSEEALVQSLQSAATDTLKEEKVDVTKVATASVKAKQEKSKKIDTYNKVIVKNENSDDEFAKLSQEIDSILNTQEVQETTKKAEESLATVVQERRKALRFIVVKKGDTLSSIARRAYGRASAYTKIYKANPDLIKNPNRIYIGMKLRVPVDEEYQGNAR